MVTFTLMMSPNVIELLTKLLEFFTSVTRQSIQTCHKMRSFVCKHFHPNWFQDVSQFCDRHMRNVLMDKQHGHYGYFCLFYIHYMGKFPGWVLKLQQNCRFWFLGQLQHVAEESQSWYFHPEIWQACSNRFYARTPTQNDVLHVCNRRQIMD